MSARGSAHGRVNLVGEHTDYNGGLVLPTLIPQQTEMVVERRSDRLIRLRTEARGMAPLEVPVDAIAPRRDWSDHVLGVVDALRRRGHDIGGFTAEVRSTVPLGAGLSSSAALGVATVRGLREAFALRIDDRDVALIAHESEDQFVGAHVGLMDQLVCSLGREGEALRIDLRDRSTRHIALDRIDMEIAVIDSGIRHQHATGDYQKGHDSGPSSTGRATPGSYNVRRRECEDAARALGVRTLRDVEVGTDTSALSPMLARRVRHVLSENARVDAERDVHRLHAVARGALDQIVDGAERDDAVAARIDGEADIGEVRPGEELRLGIAEDPTALLHDAHERLARVALAVDPPEVLLLERLLHIHVRRREDAAHELDRRAREVDARPLAAERELLIGLGGVTMSDGTERPYDADALGVVRVLRRLAAALARADLAFHDDVARAVDDVGGEEREQGEDRRRRVAAGAGDPRRSFDLAAVHLGDAVDPLAERPRPRMRRAVPGLVVLGVAQAMVGREVDDELRALLELAGSVRTVGEREEEDVAAGHVLVAHELQVGALAQVRVRRGDRLASERLAPRDDLAHLGMRQQEAEELAAGVPAGADDADLHGANSLCASRRRGRSRSSSPGCSRRSCRWNCGTPSCS